MTTYQDTLVDNYIANHLAPVVRELSRYSAMKKEANINIERLKVVMGSEFHNIRQTIGINVDLRAMRLHINWQPRFVRYKVTKSDDALAYVVVERAEYEWETTGTDRVALPQRSWELETVNDVRREMQRLGFAVPYPTEGDGNISAFRICA